MTMKMTEEMEARILKFAQQFGLGQFLSRCPDDMDYEDILLAVKHNDIPEDESGNALIVAWESVESDTGSTIATMIDDATEGFRATATDMLYELGFLTK